ncbi:GSCOCG00011107001-RA-CDS [Cotesia congregata]|uniref:Similar to Sur-8: Leucine-rich repeat protein soc-2 homolog (Culex quinquefasciatus) n=1 Tax=Cotesia congregata TaxID=51543 RepID=A0A8J2MIZ9_COTCN|nr:GSCOCG00011107001-RA-CDS [Cotesia congregata]CAG5088766.1 Similar to Sur-8: Leucine-rich repeat protein soc-2 homolog (Culex quinquefasciatus) [Cotesia congregata]
MDHQTMPEVKNRQRSTRDAKSRVQINGSLSNGSSSKIDTADEIKEEEANVSELELIQKDLNSVSDNFFKRYCNLLKLDLSDNRLSSLPSAITCLIKLETLILDRNQFREVPQVLEELECLKELSIVNNRLEDFPENFGALLKAEKINFSGNCIKFLPTSWEKMTRLKFLDLSDNYFKFIPSCIEFGMPILETLNLSDNKMNIDGRVYSHRIKKFYGRNNLNARLQFPQWIFSGKYYKFEELNFENSLFDLIKIPPNPKIIVRVLNLQRCNFTEKNISAILSDIESVEELKIGNNKYSYAGNLFTELPMEFINSPGEIKEFHSQAVGLSTISPKIKSLVNVTVIDFSRNHISWLPDEFCCLKKLEILLLAQNTLIMLPGNIGKLESLRVLDVSSNHICSLPESMRELEKIQYLDIYANDLRELPEYLKDFGSLVGFDVEQNYIDVDNYQILNFKNLRESLRAYNQSELKLDGPKAEPQSNSSNSSFSSRSSTESFSTLSNSMSQVCSIKTEDWDKDGDSADDFDAYNPPQIIEKDCFIPKYIYGNPMYFCPADLHIPRVKDVVAENYSRGKYPTRQIVEGQFDNID